MKPSQEAKIEEAQKLVSAEALQPIPPSAEGAASSEMSPLDAAADIELAESTAETVAELAEERAEGTATAKPAPMRESRVKKTLLNARVNLIFYFLTLLLSFFSRKIFLDCLGAEFIGLTGTLQNLLGFLNLAELGIGSAIGYLLYKPLFDQDQTKINEIISVMGYLYRWIGFIILGGGIIMSCFLPLIFPSTGFPLPLIYFAFYSFLGSSLIGYFINYRQNLLGADQKNYVVTAYFQTMMIVKTLLQIVLAWYTHNYYLWVAIELGFGIIYSFILNWKINQTYPWLKSEVRQGRKLFKKYPEVLSKTKQVFVHKISSFAQSQMTPMLIYAYVSLEIVAYYTNYMIIITRVSLLIGSVFSSVNAGVGNLISEGNKSKLMSTYWSIFSLYFFVTAMACFCMYVFFDPFITLWLGKQYVLSTTVKSLIVLNFFLGFSRYINDPFIFGKGMFQDIWAPLTEAVIYVLVAVIGGHYWGLAGVLLGNVVSCFVIVFLWKPYFLFVIGLKEIVLNYWTYMAKNIIIGVVILVPMAFLALEYMREINSWLQLTVTGLCIIAITGTIFFLSMMFCLKPFNSIIDRVLFKKLSSIFCHSNKG